MKTLITRCAKSLLAMATGLALATNVQAAEDWFNVNFAEATADTWLDESAEGASWSDNAAEVATFVAGDENHLAIATGDDELQIQADDTLSLADATPTVNAKVAFTAFDLEDLPAVAEDAKAGLTMVQKSDESYAVYGIAKVDDVNDWVELTEITDVEPGTYDVSITLQYTADGTQVIYDFDGTSTDPMPIIAEEAGVLAIKGKGELYSVAAEYEEVTYEAELNGVRYSTFSAAYAAAENGDEIKLLANVGQFTPPATIALKAVTVDENGYDFTVDVSDQTQYAAKGFKLVYNDGTFGVVMPFEGEGTEDTPYFIASADDMILFKNGVNAQSYAYAGSAKKYFQLTANISLTAWEGINGFYGVFDGDSNSITVQFKAIDSEKGNQYRGLFNTIVGASATDKAEIKSLVAIYNGWDTTPTGYEYGCAPFAGKVSNTLFKDCVSGIAQGDTTISVTHNASGFTVKVQDAGETIFDNCVNYTEVQTSANKAGGFVAIVEDVVTSLTDPTITGNLKFVTCANFAEISSTTTSTAGGIGGFVAYGGIHYNFEFAGCVSGCAVSATPDASSVVGAFIGNMNQFSTAADVSDEDMPLTMEMANKVRAIGKKGNTSEEKFLEEISNFKFAVAKENNVYYLVADEEVAAGDDTWVVVAPTITTWDVELAADESIAFDNELNPNFAANVTTEVEGYKIASDTKGTVTTYTCVPDVTYAFQIGSDKYETFAEAIAAANDGETIEMLDDFTGAGVVIPQGKFATEGLTINLGGFTFTGNEAVGSTGTKNQVIQILKGNKVTIKNGVITIDEAMGESFRMIVQNYSDLTLTGVTLDGTKLAMAGRNETYTFSNNCGTIVVDGDSVILASTADNTQKKFAMDTCDKTPSYAVPTVTVGAATITGDVELGGGSLVIDGATVSGNLVATDATADGQVTLKSGTVPAPEGWEWKDTENGKVLVKKAANVVVPGGAPLPVPAASAEEAEKAVTVKADRPAEVTDAIISADDYSKYFKAKAYETGTPGVYNVFAEMDEEAVKPADTEKEIANNLSNLVLDDGKLEVSGKPGLYYYVEETSVLNDSEKPFVANEAGLADADGKVKIPMTKFEGAGFYKLGVRTTATPVVE